jgi:hypothetical protein
MHQPSSREALHSIDQKGVIMTKLALPFIIAAIGLAAASVSPARAQLLHTWVASNGDNANNCDRPTPCATFLGAFDNTAAGGEITCVDSGNFSGVTIGRSITINCENVIGRNSGIGGLSSGRIHVNTAATDVVTLRGLDLDGLNGTCGACGMIEFTGAGTLHVEKVRMSNLRGPASGIRFTPNGPAKLTVSDSTITHNGENTSTAGILIRPAAGGSANVSIDRTRLDNNVNGIFVDGTGGGGAVNVNVRDSVVTGSSNVGIVTASSGPALTVLVDRTTVMSSLNVGVGVSGPAATIQLGNSTISGNVTGVLAVSGGSLRSYKNNQIKFNLTNGTPIAAVDALD